MRMYSSPVLKNKESVEEQKMCNSRLAITVHAAALCEAHYCYFN